MRSLFNPAVALMSRFHFGLKFAISGLVVFALLIYVGMLQVRTLHDRANTLQSERTATSMMTLLVEWNKVLIESRRIAITAVAGDESVRQRFKQNAALVEQMAAAAASLRSQADELVQEVSVFKLAHA